VNDRLDENTYANINSEVTAMHRARCRRSWRYIKVYFVLMTMFGVACPASNIAWIEISDLLQVVFVLSVITVACIQVRSSRFGALERCSSEHDVNVPGRDAVAAQHSRHVPSRTGITRL
jgi:hypothetical protein